MVPAAACQGVEGGGEAPCVEAVQRMKPAALVGVSGPNEHQEDLVLVGRLQEVEVVVEVVAGDPALVRGDAGEIAARMVRNLMNDLQEASVGVVREEVLPESRDGRAVQG